MSVTTSMYALRPIVNDLEIKGTSKMYNLRSIHDVKDRALDVVDEQVKRLTKVFSNVWFIHCFAVLPLNPT